MPVPLPVCLLKATSILTQGASVFTEKISPENPTLFSHPLRKPYSFMVVFGTDITAQGERVSLKQTENTGLIKSEKTLKESIRIKLNCKLLMVGNFW